MQGSRTGIQNRRTREEILADMERVYRSMSEERASLEQRIEESKEGLDAVSKQVEWTDNRVTRLEERIEEVQISTSTAIREVEDKTEKTMEDVAVKLDDNNKSMQGMTRAVLFGFCAITIAVMILFISLVMKM